MTVASGEHAVDENAELRSKVRSLEARLAMMISPPGPESTKEVLSSETSASGRGKDAKLWRRRLESRQATNAVSQNIGPPPLKFRPSSSAPTEKLIGVSGRPAESPVEEQQKPEFASESGAGLGSGDLLMEVAIPRRRGVLDGNDEEEEDVEHAANWDGPESEIISQLVRAENAELVEIVETQHACLADQQARTSQAEREVQRLSDEAELMRSALSAADEFSDSLRLRADTAEREMLTLLTNQEVLEAHVAQLASMRSSDDFEYGSSAETFSEFGGGPGSDVGALKAGTRLSLERSVSWSQGQQLQEQQELLLTMLKKQEEERERRGRQLRPFHWFSIGVAAGVAATVAVVMTLRRAHREADTPPPFPSRLYSLDMGRERYGR